MVTHESVWCPSHDVFMTVELLELCMHRPRPRSTARGWSDDDDSVGFERNLSRRMCDTSAVHDHAVLDDICHRRHTDAAADGYHQVS